jgi:hypothetical protein
LSANVGQFSRGLKPARAVKGKALAARIDPGPVTRQPVAGIFRKL